MISPESGQPDGTDGTEWQQDNHRMATLIVRAREGDLAAFEALYNGTARWLLWRVRRLVDDSHAEDVLAEVFLQVWKTLDSYDAARAAPRVWLAMIARSRALDHLRREKRRGEVHGCPEVAGVADEVQEDGPEQLASRAEQGRLVRVSLAGAHLSSDERKLLGMVYYGEHTQLEISSLTGLPLGTVKSTIARGQAKLRASYVMACAGSAGALVTGLAA